MSLFDQEDIDNKDYLAELTGPGGKFDRTKYASEAEMYQAIAKGKVYGDRTIEQRNKDFDDLREDFVKAQANATSATKFEELKALLEKRVDTGDITTQMRPVETQLDPVKIEELLDQKLTQREMKAKEDANMNAVETRLRERFGDNAKSIMRDKMNTLGMTAEDLKFLAKRSPEAVLNALGVNSVQQETYQGTPSSSFRSDNFVPQADIRDALYYDKMRREKPKEYFSEKMSVQRLKDMDDNPDFLKRLRETQRRSL